MVLFTILFEGISVITQYVETFAQVGSCNLIAELLAVISRLFPLHYAFNRYFHILHTNRAYVKSLTPPDIGSPQGPLYIYYDRSAI